MIEQLKAELAVLKRARFGTSSEKLARIIDQLELALGECEADEAAADEALAGILMTAGALVFIPAPIALFIGTVGAVSIFKAVYIDKRELKCACVGGSSSVPLGFVSLTESLMMLFMGIWMPLKALLLS